MAEVSYNPEQTELFIRKGDRKVYEEIFRAYYAMLVQYAQRILKDYDEAEEMVQQVYLNIWEKRATFSLSVPVKSYLFRAVHNRCLNAIAKVKVRQEYVSDVIAAEQPHEHDPADYMQHSELRTHLKDAMQKLPEQCRKVFELSRFEHKKYAEIAEHLNIAVKTVENQMGKALRILREELKDYLVLLTVFLTRFL